MRILDQGPRVEPEQPPRAKSSRRGWIMLASLVVLAAAVGFAAGLYVNRDESASPDNGVASARVVALIDNMTADYNRGDMDAFAAHFTPNAVWEESGNTLRGRERIAEAMQWLSDNGAAYHRNGIAIQQGHMVSVPMSASMHAPGLLDVIEFNADWKIVHYWSNAG